MQELGRTARVAHCSLVLTVSVKFAMLKERSFSTTSTTSIAKSRKKNISKPFT